MTSRPSRRAFLRGAAFGLLAAPLAGCERVARWLASADNSGFDPTSYSFETSDLCLLTAEAIRGPFYIPDALVRSEIAEGHPGAPLRLRLKVVDVDGCRPLPGMAVEVWHADASGHYSGYPSYPPDDYPFVDPEEVIAAESDERFCRGIQFTDADGFVEFQTIVPGWYAPRTPHVHVRVATPGPPALGHDDERVLLTTQLYFPDRLTTRLAASWTPYRERGPSPFTNRNDRVIHESGGADGGFLRMSRKGDTLIGTLTLGVAS